MAFIAQETVRKQQRHYLSWGMYTLIAVFVHFNHFIDLKINFHTDPYNLASSRLLWFWGPCGVSTANFPPIRGIPQLEESGFLTVVWNPESFALDSRIQLKETGIPLTIGIQNPRRGMQNPTRDDSQQRFLAHHSVATLLRHCFECLQHCSNIATMCSTKNRRCESSRVTSPLHGAVIL